MKSLKRGRFDIITDILDITEREKTKTPILYGANLSFKQMQEYLGLLVDLNLLSLDENNGKSCYKTTDKGFRFLEKYREIQNLLNDKKIEPMRTLNL
jgi:predicted transcriptional regulator